MSRLLPSLALTALSLALTACGGGGASDSTSSGAPANSGVASNSGSPATTNNSTPSTPPPGTLVAKSDVSLFPAPGAAAASYAASGNATTDALAYTNYQRQLLGLPALTYQASVAQAALNHANYMANNNVFGHGETAGVPGYTGATPYDRINSLYPTYATGEVIANFGSTSTAFVSDQLIKQLFNAPFHRNLMLRDYLKAGAGYATSTQGSWHYHYLDLDMADMHVVVPNNQVVAYPYSGQVGVPTGWVDDESPDPMPGYAGKTVGYPITLQASNGGVIDVQQFALVDNTSQTVSCNMVDHNVNAEADQLAICTPYAALKAKTTYTVTVVGTVTRNGVVSNFNISWSFTTA